MMIDFLPIKLLFVVNMEILANGLKYNGKK